MKKLILFVVLVFVAGSLSAPGMAQMQIGIKAVGAKLGFVMPEDPIESTFGFGLVSDLGTITPAIHVSAFMEYWRKSYDAGFYEWFWSDLAIGGTGKYYVAMEAPFDPYVGGGLGLHLHKCKWETQNPILGSTESSNSEIDLGIHLLGGADYPLGPQMKAFGELRYTVADPDYFALWGGILYALK